MQNITSRIDTTRIAEAVVGLMFTLAAATKILAPPGFLLVCHYLFVGIIGPGMTAGIAIAVVTVEVAIGVRFLIGKVGGKWLWFTGGLLVAFSFALVVLVRDPLAPPCACVGIARVVGRANAEAPLGLVRNAALLWLLALLLINRTGLRRKGDFGRSHETPSPSSN